MKRPWSRPWPSVTVVLTYSESGCSFLGVLAVVVVKVEQMLHLPVRQQRAVQTEHNWVAAVYAAEPDWKPGGLQHAAHLQTATTGGGSTQEVQLTQYKTTACTCFCYICTLFQFHIFSLFCFNQASRQKLNQPIRRLDAQVRTSASLRGSATSGHSDLYVDTSELQQPERCRIGIGKSSCCWSLTTITFLHHSEWKWSLAYYWLSDTRLLSIISSYWVSNSDLLIMTWRWAPLTS